MKPEELEAYLNEHIIKQDEAKAILATKVCTHFNRVKQELKNDKGQNLPVVGRIKNNIVMIGPTGVGKSYMVKLIANKLGVPFVKGDATKFSETGYVGGDVEDLVRDLVQQANDDIELAQYGIIYVDEIDKITASGKHIGPDVSRTGVQRALLKPMEETEVDLNVPHDLVSQIQAIEQYRKTGKREKRVVNTRNILFIVSGAFNGLTEIVKKRVKKQGIGFGADLSTKDIDLLFVVSDPSRRGMVSARRICDLVDELGIRVERKFLMINRYREGLSRLISQQINGLGPESVATIPENTLIYQYDLKGKPTIELPSESVALKAVSEVFTRLLGEESLGKQARLAS